MTGGNYSHWWDGTVPGGNRAHRLWPTSRAFQALVARGSTWRPLPLRAGPITNHLQRNRANQGSATKGLQAICYQALVMRGSACCHHMQDPPAVQHHQSRVCNRTDQEIVSELHATITMQIDAAAAGSTPSQESTPLQQQHHCTQVKMDQPSVGEMLTNMDQPNVDAMLTNRSSRTTT